MMTRRFRRRVPFVPQMEATECGAACLGSVLAFHGSFVPLAELRECCGVSRDGMTARDLLKAATIYGLETRALKCDLDGLATLATPAILHWEHNHFVVLERLRPDGADLVDPAVGRRRVTADELSRGFTGIVLCPRPGPGFVRRPRSARSLAQYGAMLRLALRPARMMLVSAVALELIGLVQPAALQVVIDFVFRPRQDRWLVPLLIVLAVTMILRAALQLARDRILAGLGARADLEMSVGFLEHLMSLPTSFFAQRSVGELVSRAHVLLHLRESVTDIVLGGFDAVLIIAYVTLLFGYAPTLGAVVAVLALARLGVLVAIQPSLRLHETATNIAAGRSHGALVAAFSDPESHKAFGAQQLLLARFVAARTDELNAQTRGRHVAEAAQQVLFLLDGVGLAAVLWLGGSAVIAEQISVGVLSSFVAVEALLRRPTQGLVKMLLAVGRLSSKLDRVDDVFDTPPEARGTVAPSRLEGAIVFENVSFRYGPKSPLILDDISFSIRPKERVAIVGHVGSGKSTLLKLVLGVLRPTSGRVLIDGRDVAEYDPTCLRRRIGTVLYGSTFFDEPVIENIALGTADADIEAARRAADAACVDDVVNSLPDGYQTRLGGGARQLSGGQRQRLQLARALVKEPDVLLLDEASSALDARLEAKVNSYLSALECTMVIVAHRTTALSVATRILRLEAGRLAEMRERSLAEGRARAHLGSAGAIA